MNNEEDLDVGMLLMDISKLITEIENKNGEVELFMQRLQLAINCMNQLDYIEEIPQILTNCQIILQLLQREERDVNKNDRLAIYNISRSQESVSGPGRPKLIVEEEVLLHFRELGFTWKEISNLLLVSRWTIYRRVKEYGIESLTGFTDISNEELDRIVSEFKRKHGKFVGRSMVMGHLRATGLRIQQKRVTKSLVRVNPSSSRMRWAALIKRRKYSVPGPNSLWHADGHHSLINWGFVIHGAIDGYSRLIVFLKCATNNKKETVCTLFEQAIEDYGVPSRLRTDKGGENVLLWTLMEDMRGVNRGSFIAGSSTRNQRIERLWRDVWTYVAANFYYTFQGMESEGLLDMENPQHVYILHYLFVPRINQIIDSFWKGWNTHPLRSEKNWSPRRLWVNGMIDKRNRNQVQVSELLSDQLSVDDIEWYGFDPQAPSPVDITTSQVNLDDSYCPFTNVELNLLSSIDPLKTSSVFGIDIYTEALDLLNL